MEENNWYVLSYLFHNVSLELTPCHLFIVLHYSANYPYHSKIENIGNRNDKLLKILFCFSSVWVFFS